MSFKGLTFSEFAVHTGYLSFKGILELIYIALKSPIDLSFSFQLGPIEFTN